MLSANDKGVFDGHLAFGKVPALIIVDMVMAYFDETSPLYAGVEAAAESAARLIDAARIANIPVIHTNVIYQAGGKNGGLFYKKVPALKCFDTGSPLGEFHPKLKPGAGDVVITKQYASAFFGTSLASMLAALKVDTLVIAGVSTSGCVRATALDAIQHGFAPFVIKEACGDRHHAPHEANLFDLQAKYAEVIDEKTALSFIAQSQ